jgi:predicted GH43/DUF377 family glycosyl hydrolase
LTENGTVRIYYGASDQSVAGAEISLEEIMEKLCKRFI